MPRLPSIPSGEALNLRGHERKAGTLSPLATSEEEMETTEDEGHEKYIGSFHRQSSPCSVISVASSGYLYADPGQTLIFLDWDDTLFPCYEIFSKRLYSKRTREWVEPLPPELDKELQPWRSAVQDFLSRACALSDRCVILTNAKPPWVEKSIEHFAPNLQAILNRRNGPKIVYASSFMRRKSMSDIASERAEGYIIKFLKASFGHCFNDFITKMIESMAAMRQYAPTPHFDLTEAKFEAMKAEAGKFYSQYQGQTWKNIISLGDMAYEYEAVKALTASRVPPEARERLRTKRVSLLQTPSLHGLTLQLRMWTSLLDLCTRFDGDIDLDMETLKPFEELAKALQVPSLEHLQVPLAYLQPGFDGKAYVTVDEERAADELLEELTELLRDAVTAVPVRETFVKAV